MKLFSGGGGPWPEEDLGVASQIYIVMVCNCLRIGNSKGG
jgi:hypothetical protein